MTGILVREFVIVIFIFLRIFSALMAAPVFSNRALPFIVKLLLSIFIAYLVFLTLDTSGVTVQFSVWFLALFAIKEIFAGMIMGFFVNIIFYGIRFAGTFIAFDMGLMMANVMNPLEETNSSVLGEFIYTSAIILMFLINGHHYIIEGIYYSFKVIPLGHLVMNKEMHELLVQYSASVFVLAVKISSPILVSFFLIHLAEGVVARVIPQMQVFFVTQPMKIGIGFVLLAASTPILFLVIKNLLEAHEENLLILIKAME